MSHSCPKCKAGPSYLKPLYAAGGGTSYICRSCNATWPDQPNHVHEVNGMAQDRVCNSCGGALNEDSKFCPACGASVETPSAGDCPSCGEKNAPDSKYCDKCGSLLQEQNQEPPESPSQQQSETTELEPNTEEGAEFHRYDKLREEQRLVDEWKDEALTGKVGFSLLLEMWHEVFGWLWKSRYGFFNTVMKEIKSPFITVYKMSIGDWVGLVLACVFLAFIIWLVNSYVLPVFW